jgi:addiction module HigA family antidote
MKNQYFPQVFFHPGETLGEKLQEMGLSSEELASKIGQPLYIIEEILQQKRDITPEIALLLEGITKIPAHMWLTAQYNYNEFQKTNSSKPKTTWKTRKQNPTEKR